MGWGKVGRKTFGSTAKGSVILVQLFWMQPSCTKTFSMLCWSGFFRCECVVCLRCFLEGGDSAFIFGCSYWDQLGASFPKVLLFSHRLFPGSGVSLMFSIISSHFFCAESQKLEEPYVSSDHFCRNSHCQYTDAHFFSWSHRWRLWRNARSANPPFGEEGASSCAVCEILKLDFWG